MPCHTVGDLIAEEDYDYISFRLQLPDKVAAKTEMLSILIGIAKSKNGELIPLDGDCYDLEALVCDYELWENPEKGINKGITITVKGRQK